MFVLLSLCLYVRACVHVCVCVYRDFSPGGTLVTAVGILGFYPKYIGLAPFFFFHALNHAYTLHHSQHEKTQI